MLKQIIVRTRRSSGGAVRIHTLFGGTLYLTFWFPAAERARVVGLRIGWIALINSLGNLAGYLGPQRVAWLTTGSSDFSFALLSLGIAMLLSAAIVDENEWLD